MTPQAAQRTGSRQRLPENALRVCASCLAPRGNVRRGWETITRAGEVVGWTCPECPTWDEPIRRETVSGERVRYIAVLRGTEDPDTGKRPQLKRRFDSLEQARAWVEEVRQGVAAASGKGATYSDPSKLTVATMVDRWLKHRELEVGTPGGIRESTLNGYRSSVHALLLHMGDRPAREVTVGEVEATLRTLATVGGKWRRGLSHRSVVYALTSLRQAYTHAIRENWLTSSPAELARAPRQQHSKKQESKAATSLRWTPAELARFRAEADDYGEGEAFTTEPWLRAGMRLTLTGMRRSEVLGLDWTRVDLGVGTVEVAASRVKTGRGTATTLGEVKAENSLRTIQAEVIHPGTKAALRDLWMAQGQPEAGLVIRDALGEPVDPDTYSGRFRGLCRAAGLPALRSIHNVRHTLATALQAAGVPDHEAAALLGHDVATYRRFYLVTDDSGAAAAAAAAGRLFAI